MTAAADPRGVADSLLELLDRIAAVHAQAHADHRLYAKVERLRSDDGAIPAYLSALFEAAHPLKHGRGRQAQRLRKVSVGLATVALQGDQDVVEHAGSDTRCSEIGPCAPAQVGEAADVHRHHKPQFVVDRRLHPGTSLAPPCPAQTNACQHWAAPTGARSGGTWAEHLEWAPVACLSS